MSLYARQCTTRYGVPVAMAQRHCGRLDAHWTCNAQTFQTPVRALSLSSGHYRQPIPAYRRHTLGTSDFGECEVVR
jgi:hypothetical protein